MVMAEPLTKRASSGACHSTRPPHADGLQEGGGGGGGGRVPYYTKFQPIIPPLVVKVRSQVCTRYFETPCDNVNYRRRA